ncbi:MAG TPA: hypothetical protein VIK51_14140 [Vicinamibacteria bacterium]|jgi:hypothetical protein
MKRSKLSHARLAKNLGSRVAGSVRAGAGYFGALQVAEDVRRRFKAAPRGGRARDPEWTQKRLLPFRPETLARLQTLAARVSEIVEFRVEPLQVAALLVERDLERLDDRDVVEAVASATRKHA